MWWVLIALSEGVQPTLGFVEITGLTGHYANSSNVSAVEGSATHVQSQHRSDRRRYPTICSGVPAGMTDNFARSLLCRRIQPCEIAAPDVPISRSS